jgi:hypothetical protein
MRESKNNLARMVLQRSENLRSKLADATRAERQDQVVGLRGRRDGADSRGKVGRESDTRAAVHNFDALSETLGSDARDRLLAGRVDGQDDDGIGVAPSA